MAEYAKTTNVSPENRMVEIKRTLERYGATAFAFVQEADSAAVLFEIHGRRMRMNVLLPDRNEKRFTRLPTRTWESRTPQAAERAYQQVVRQRWAALSLFVKALCEAVDNKIVSPETAFQPYIMLPDGRTLGQFLAPQIEKVYESGEMPALLPGSAG